MLSKDKLRYFSHDVDMRNDIKIRGLRSQFGNDGYAVWCYLLEVLTDSEDLAVDIDSMEELLSVDFDVEQQRLRGIIEYCLKVGLFVKDGSALYSVRHRERIIGVMEKAAEKSERGRKAVMARWGKANSTHTEEAYKDTDVIHTNTNKIREDKIKEDKKIEYPCDGVVRLWNEICVSLPKVMRLSDARREKVKARLREWGDTEPDKMLDNARSLFLRIESSDFLTGRSGKWKGASFDWIFDSRNNWIKVMEGNYDNVRVVSDAQSSTKRLGVGEYIDGNGNRTYGSGKAIIPQDAPPRPSASHSWNASNNQWILQ